MLNDWPSKHDAMLNRLPSNHDELPIAQVVAVEVLNLRPALLGVSASAKIATYAVLRHMLDHIGITFRAHLLPQDVEKYV